MFVIPTSSVYLTICFIFTDVFLCREFLTFLHLCMTSLPLGEGRWEGGHIYENRMGPLGFV